MKRAAPRIRALGAEQSEASPKFPCRIAVSSLFFLNNTIGNSLNVFIYSGYQFHFEAPYRKKRKNKTSPRRAIKKKNYTFGMNKTNHVSDSFI